MASSSPPRSLIHFFSQPPPFQRFSVLGSTGSIGTQTLDIAAEHGDKFEIVALSAGGNIDLLAEQVRKRKGEREERENKQKTLRPRIKKKNLLSPSLLLPH